MRVVLRRTRRSHLSQSSRLITPARLWTQNQSSRSIDKAFFIIHCGSAALTQLPLRLPPPMSQLPLRLPRVNSVAAAASSPMSQLLHPAASPPDVRRGYAPPLA